MKDQRDPDELVQTIIVASTGSHENTVQAVALASVQAWLTSPDDPAWAVWFSQPFAKTVRRMKPARMERLPVARASVTVEDSRAMAYQPMRYEEFPPELARAQVQGTDFPRSGWPVFDPDDAGTVLVLNPDVAEVMSTGKTAAQAAHALMGHLLALPANERTVPDAVKVRVASNAAAFEGLVRESRTVIADAGRTEIAPNTVTFVVR